MECNYTCFDRVLHLVKKLPKEKLKECDEIIREYTFVDLLDFCIENECFTKEQAQTIYDFIVMWEDLDGNYWEEDFDKLHRLYSAIGIE